MRMTLRLLPGRYAVCRLAPGSPLPSPSGEEDLWSVTRTRDEVSVVLPEAGVQEDWKAETGWRCFEVAGPLDFSLTGVMAALTVPLADAGVSVFAVSTYDTDYVMVREADLGRAREALTAAGHDLC